MANPLELGGVSKPLADYTLAEIETGAQGARPARPGDRRPMNKGSNLALLAETMRGAGAGTVADLGPDAVGRWEQMFGLQFASKAQIFKSLGSRQQNE